MKTKDSNELVEIMPLKSHQIRHNEYEFDIIEGEKISIPQFFIPTLIAEKVIKAKKES